MSKKAKDKANEYAETTWIDFKDSMNECVFTNTSIKRFCRTDFLIGYCSRDAEVSKLKEVLAEIIDSEKGVNYDISDKFSFNANTRHIAAIKEAKNLLKNE